MKPSFLLPVAIVLALSAPARADDASDCNHAVQAPEAAISACTRMLDNASGEDARKILLLRSRAYAATKQFDAALADTAQMAVVAPENKKYTAIFARGYVHGLMRDYDSETADYDEVLKTDPQNYIAISNRCGALARSNRDLNEALVGCNAMVARSGGPSPDLVNRAFAYLRLGRFKEALADYDLLVKSNMAYAFGYYGRGIAELRLGDAGNGSVDIAKAVAMQSNIADDFKPFGLMP